MIMIVLVLSPQKFCASDIDVLTFSIPSVHSGHSEFALYVLQVRSPSSASDCASYF